MRKFILVCVVSLFLEGPAFSATIYQLTDLGTLGGDTSAGTAINDNGTAVGFSETNGDGRAFVWTEGGGMQDLGSAGGGESKASDINNAGHIVGSSGNQSFRWTSAPSGMVLIDPGSNGSANGLNASSSAIGYRGTTAGQTVRWDSANTASPQFGVSVTKGLAINDSGQFVGQAFFNADGSGGVGFYSPGDGSSSNLGFFYPTDLNNSRILAGSFDVFAAIRNQNVGSNQIIGKLSPSDSVARALGVNDAGTVVGFSQGTGGFVYDTTTGMQSLTSMLAPESNGWTVLSADDINNHGQVVGTGRFGGLDHAIILTPIPEPAGPLLALLGSLIVAGTLRVPWQKCRKPLPCDKN